MDIGYVPAFTYICIAVLLEVRVAGLLRAVAATSGWGTETGTIERRADKTTKTNQRATNRKSQIFRLICFTRMRASRGRDLRADASLRITRRSDGLSPSCFLPLIFFSLSIFCWAILYVCTTSWAPPPAWALGRRPLAIPPGPALSSPRLLVPAGARAAACHHASPADGVDCFSIFDWRISMQKVRDCFVNLELTPSCTNSSATPAKAGPTCYNHGQNGLSGRLVFFAKN